MRISRKPLLVAALSAGMLATSATGALAYGSRRPAGRVLHQR